MNKKTKSLIPRYRFPEFKENDKWKYLSLEQIADISMGVSPPSTAYNENNEGLPLLQGNADIKDRQSSPRIHTKEITKECKIGDILLSVRAPVGTVAKSIHNACIGRGLATLKCYKDYEQNFLYQFLINYESKWGNISQGGTFDSVNSSEIKKLNIPIPSLPEQQKIADCLSSLDELITAENQQLEVLKTHKKGLMQKLFPEEVESSEDGSLDHPTPSGHPSKGGELRAVPKMRFPEFRGKGKWELKKLGDVAEFFKGKGISKEDIELDGKYYCIRYGQLYTIYGEIINNVYSKTNLSKNLLFFSKKNDVIIPSSGETKKDIARASCILIENVALGGDLNIIRSDLNGVFLSYYLSGAKKNDISKVAQGDTVVHLYSTQLKKLSINFPSLPEQQKIADCLSSLDELITAQAKKIELLKTHKKALLQGLFPGETN